MIYPHIFIFLLLAFLVTLRKASICFGKDDNDEFVCSSHGSCQAENFCNCTQAGTEWWYGEQCEMSHCGAGHLRGFTKKLWVHLPISDGEVGEWKSLPAEPFKKEIRTSAYEPVLFVEVYIRSMASSSHNNQGMYRIIVDGNEISYTYAGGGRNFPRDLRFRGMTTVDPGWHTVEVQYRVPDIGNEQWRVDVHMGLPEHHLAVHSLRSDQAFYVDWDYPDGITMESTTYVDVPGEPMVLQFSTTKKATFKGMAEIGILRAQHNNRATVFRMSLDGEEIAVTNEARRHVNLDRTTPMSLTGVYHDLEPGNHELRILWRLSNTGFENFIGQRRLMVVMYESENFQFQTWRGALEAVPPSEDYKSLVDPMKLDFHVPTESTVTITAEVSRIQSNGVSRDHYGLFLSPQHAPEEGKLIGGFFLYDYSGVNSYRLLKTFVFLEHLDPGLYTIELKMQNTVHTVGFFSHATEGRQYRYLDVTQFPKNPAGDECLCSDEISGEFCEYHQCYGIGANMEHVCGHHGECLMNGNCDCELMYTGDECNIYTCFAKLNTDSSVCSGNGKCVQVDECLCDPGYSGFQCQVQRCFGILSGSGSVCSGHGTCVSGDNCECQEDLWTGEQCEIPVCFGISAENEDVCSNGNGTCVGPNDCVCHKPDEYNGNDCGFPVCFGKFQKGDFCSGHGNCTLPDQCSCEFGYSGTECEVIDCFGLESSDPNVCNGHGECSSFNNCDCEYGYDGLDCNQFECFNVSHSASNVCSIHGECIAYNDCSCDEDYQGVDCNVTTCFSVLSTNDTSCNAHGICKLFDECECDDGYLGEACETVLCFEKQADDESVCGNHGECLAPNNCKCDDGYFGSDCELLESKLRPIAMIQGPDRISSCQESVHFSALTSSDPLGSKLSYTWTLNDELLLIDTAEISLDQSQLLNGQNILSLVVVNKNNHASRERIHKLFKTQGNSLQVVISGDRIVSVLRQTTIHLEATAVLSICNQNPDSMEEINYQWESDCDLSLALVSGNMLIYPQNENLNCHFIVHATALNHGISSNASAVVHYRLAPIVCVIRGGSRNFPINQVIELDGTDSDDPENSELRYQWNCHSDDCQSIIFPSTPKAYLPANYLSLGSHEISLIVQDLSSQRHCERKISLNIVDNDFPPVHITGPKRINQNEVLELHAHAIGGESPIQPSWYWSSPDMSLQSNFFIPFNGEEWNRKTMILKENVLMAGQEYTFRATLGSDRFLTYSEYTVLVNDIPSGGSFDVSPKIGVQAITNFRLTASNWYDSDGSIRYQFFYVGNNGVDILLTPTFSHQNEVNTIIPVANEIIVGVMIRDVYGAATRVTQKIVVMENTADPMNQSKSLISGLYPSKVAILTPLKNALTFMNDRECHSDCVDIRHDILDKLIETYKYLDGIGASFGIQQYFREFMETIYQYSEINNDELVFDTIDLLHELVCHQSAFPINSYKAILMSLSNFARHRKSQEQRIRFHQEALNIITCLSTKLISENSIGFQPLVAETQFYSVYFGRQHPALMQQKRMNLEVDASIGSSIRLSDEFVNETRRGDYFVSIISYQLLINNEKIATHVMNLSVYDENMNVLESQLGTDQVVLTWTSGSAPYDVETVRLKSQRFVCKRLSDEQWLSDDCMLVKTSPEEISCRCNDTNGFFAVFIQDLEVVDESGFRASLLPWWAWLLMVIPFFIIFACLNWLLCYIVGLSYLRLIAGLVQKYLFVPIRWAASRIPKRKKSIVRLCAKNDPLQLEYLNENQKDVMKPFSNELSKPYTRKQMKEFKNMEKKIDQTFEMIRQIQAKIDYNEIALDQTKKDNQELAIITRKKSSKSKTPSYNDTFQALEREKEKSKQLQWKFAQRETDFLILKSNFDTKKTKYNHHKDNVSKLIAVKKKTASQLQNANDAIGETMNDCGSHAPPLMDSFRSKMMKDFKRIQVLNRKKRELKNKVELLKFMQ